MEALEAYGEAYSLLPPYHPARLVVREQCARLYKRLVGYGSAA
jgi:hypothetical protein